jgi:hypothetical protein
MSADAYLLQVINQYKQPTGGNSKAHKTAYLLYPFIQEWAEDYLEGVYFSGSYAKETGVIGSADLDLFISLKSNTDFTLSHIYDSLHDWFSSKGFITRKQNVSIGIQYNGLDIDLVLGRIQKGFLRYHSLYKSKRRITSIILILFLGFILFVGYRIYDSKSYYPNLPTDVISKREALEKIKNSSDLIVELAEDDNYKWVVFKGNQSDGGKRLIEMMRLDGWNFVQQEGAGYFFVRDGEKKIITSQMWTGDYVLYKISRD